MNNKIKNIVTTFVFVGVIAFFAVLCCMRVVDPVERLDVERRDAAQLPSDFTWQQFLDNKPYLDSNGDEQQSPIKQFESFAVEQFPFRQFFRNVKVFFAMDVLNVRENNGYVMENGSVATVTPEYSEDELKRLQYQVSVLTQLYDRYIAQNGGKHYLTIVPDKNYYLGRDYGYIAPDYVALVNQMTTALPNMNYVDLFDSLTLDDYYKTDWHWDQSKLDGVMATLGNAMGFGECLSGEYDTNVLEGFAGGYYGSLNDATENLTYLTNDVLKDCVLISYDNMGKEIRTELYFPDVFHNTENYANKVDYDFFMNGRCGIQRIENPNATTDKELIVFRDSYGASILPLMAEGYKTIYSIDLRDTMWRMLGTTINFEGKDVLFMFSTTVLTGDEAFK